MIRRLLGVCFVAAAAASTASAQDRYRPPADSVFMLLINPYKMYWVRGGDTVGEPVDAVSVEAQAWRSVGSQLQVAVRQLQLDVNRRSNVDTFAITPFGAVQTINGHAPGLNERVDFLLRLPGRKLAQDVSWSDTLRSTQGGRSGTDLYEVPRTYRVRRLFDSGGSPFAEITAVGVVHYRHSFWRDSVAGTFVQFDVTGPDTERFVFAVKSGQLLHRTWSMHLTGFATGMGGAGGPDTVPAGLISGETQDTISRAHAHLLTRSLPGADTAFTIASGGGLILLHTVRRAGDSVEASLGRNDGMLGTARARFAAGIMQSYDALWTDTAATPRRMSIVLGGDSLRIRDAQGGDTTVVIPTPWWGVADYAMNEFLVPTYLAHSPDDSSASFAIYRPYARHWDVGVASVRRLGEHFVASYRLGSDSLATFLLITKDGDLLMGENSGPTRAQRVPVGSARRARLEEILKLLQR